jgi:hypothetical protein
MVRFGNSGLIMRPLEIQNVIEEVTRRVIALTASQSGNTSGIASESNKSQVAVVDDKVISTQQLNDLPHGLKVIQIDGKSLITPAAADWLRERNIDVQRVDTRSIGENQNIDNERNKWVRLNVGSAECSDSTDGSELFDCIVKASSRCTEAIDNGNRVILLTDSVSVALIALNRNKKMRAIGVSDVKELRKNANATYANIFVVSRESAQPSRLIQQIELVPRNTVSPPQWL